MAPATDYASSFLGRISIRRNQVVSMDVNSEQELEDLDLFQTHMAEQFAGLVPPSFSEDGSPRGAPETLLSIAWLTKLLDVFLSCEAEFKSLLLAGRFSNQICKPPVDRLVFELLDRSVKAMDICNAVVNGVDSVRHCQRLAEIAVAGLRHRPLNDGGVRRAKRALVSLVAALSAGDKEHSVGKSTERSRSFDRSHRPMGKSWSAAKQIQAMAANLVPPRVEPMGFASPVFSMSGLIVFMVWVLVAAIPCQDRAGLATPLTPPQKMGLLCPLVSSQKTGSCPLGAPQKLVSWGKIAFSLQDVIGEEWKRKEKKGTSGLMEELQSLERSGKALLEFAETFQFPAGVAEEEKVANLLVEMEESCRRMEEGLFPLQMKIREVFHAIVTCRAQILEVVEQAGKVSS